MYEQELTRLQVEEFLQSCPEFGRMVVRSRIVLLKYWFSASDAEQESRFQSRIDDPARRWKLSPMDLEAHTNIPYEDMTTPATKLPPRNEQFFVPN